MSNSHSQSLKRGVAAVAAVVSLMVVAAPSRAAIVATFDPLFGPTIPNLGFYGTTTFEVSRGCYAQAAAAGGLTFVQNDGVNCVMSATSAEINYYNFTDQANQIQSGVLTTVDLDSSYFPQGYVIDALFDGTGQVLGFDTTDSGIFTVIISQSSSNSNNPIYYNGAMELFFTSPIVDPAQLVDCTAAYGSTTPYSYGSSVSQNCSRRNNANSNFAPVTITQDPNLGTAVPEPETLRLALLGLAAVAVSRRRRSKASLG